MCRRRKKKFGKSGYKHVTGCILQKHFSLLLVYLIAFNLFYQVLLSLMQIKIYSSLNSLQSVLIFKLPESVRSFLLVTICQIQFEFVTYSESIIFSFRTRWQCTNLAVPRVFSYILSKNFDVVVGLQIQHTHMSNRKQNQWCRGPTPH